MESMNKKIAIPMQKTMFGSFAIFECSLTNKSYVCPGWFEVPYGTKREDIVITGMPAKVAAKRAEFKVKGSTGSMYTVVIDTINGNSCNCVGYTYRRACKHIESVKHKI